MPLFHTAGSVMTVLGCTSLHCTHVLVESFEPGLTLELLDAISSLFPMVEPQTTLIDPRPAMRTASWKAVDAR